VQSTLPAATTTANAPQVTIGDQRDVTITVGWQSPGENSPHQLVVSTRITD
jgi:hypothetical protein